MMEIVKPDFLLLYSNNKELLGNYLEAATLLQMFIANPDEIADKLSTSTNETISEAFKSVVLGLKGQQTRGKAIEIGKQKIVDYIKFISESIKKDYYDTKVIVEHCKNSISNDYVIISENMDIKTIMLRKEAALKNPTSTDFMEGRTVSTLLPIIGSSSSTNLGVNGYLNKLRYILSTLTNVDISALKVAESVFTNKKTFIRIESEYIDKNSFRKELRDNILEFDEVIPEYNEYITKMVQNITSEGDVEKSINDTLNMLIDTLEPTLVKISKSIVEYNLIINALTNDNNEYFTYLEKLDAIVSNYAEVKITEEQFLYNLDAYITCLSNYLNVNSDFVTTIVNSTNKIKSALNIYMSIFTIVDKTTLAGTLTSNMMSTD